MKDLVLAFPIHGLDVAAPFRMERSVKVGETWSKMNTCQHAVNVRTFEDGRGIGGSRPGLSRYVNQKINDYWICQHISVLVTTNASAVA